jgi:hypothetical protein
MRTGFPNNDRQSIGTRRDRNPMITKPIYVAMIFLMGQNGLVTTTEMLGNAICQMAHMPSLRKRGARVNRLLNGFVAQISGLSMMVVGGDDDVQGRDYEQRKDCADGHPCNENGADTIASFGTWAGDQD